MQFNVHIGFCWRCGDSWRWRCRDADGSRVGWIAPGSYTHHCDGLDAVSLLVCLNGLISHFLQGSFHDGRQCLWRWMRSFYRTPLLPAIFGGGGQQKTEPDDANSGDDQNDGAAALDRNNRGAAGNNKLTRAEHGARTTRNGDALRRAARGIIEPGLMRRCCDIVILSKTRCCCLFPTYPVCHTVVILPT